MKDYIYTAVCKYSMNSTLGTFFPEYEVDTINFELKEGPNGVWEIKENVPLGFIDISKIQYADKDGNIKETFDFVKNKLSIDKFPDTITQNEKETLIKNKEEILKSKENSLTMNIKHIEEMKKTEHKRLAELETFLASIPYSLDDIFEKTTKELSDSEKEMIPIFAFMEKDEYSIFRKLYEIFFDYQKFYDDDTNNNNTLDIEGMMNFFKNYFDHSKDELSSFLIDFQKLYISRMEENLEFNFLEFVHTILSLLYNIQIYKNISIEIELKNIYTIHQKRLEDISYKAMYKDEGVNLIINLNAEFLKNLFMRFSAKRFENYYEVPLNQYLAMAKEISQKKGHDYFKMIAESKTNDSINFFDFLERVVFMGINVYESNDCDHQTKVETFITELKVIYEDQLEK
jgi:hypothetical protein